MPTLKAKDLRTLSIDELTEKAEALRKNRFELRVQAKFGKLDDLSKLKQVRRDIAKILTVKRQTELQKNG